MTIISHEHRYIFLKSRKTAGTSVEALLARHSGAQDILAISQDVVNKTGIERRNTARGLSTVGPATTRRLLISLPAAIRQGRYPPLVFQQHMSAKEVKEAVGPKTWNQYFKFTIERNPYHRLISFYNWRKYWFGFDWDFETFSLAALSDYPLTRRKYHATGFSNRPFYLNGESDQLCVDHVVRFEDINNELSAISNNIGLSNINSEISLPHFKQIGSTYKLDDWYSELLKRRAGYAFSLEAEIFGYRYD